MPHAREVHRLEPLPARVNRVMGWLCSFALAAAGALAVTISVTVEAFHSARLAALLVLLLMVHLVRYPRLLLRRENLLYVCFVGYIAIALCWTDDVRLAMNTLIPAIAFVFVLFFFGTLAAYHNLRAVLAGTLFGLLMGAATYTVTTGFPFVYPVGFPYNSIAGIYLLGLFLTLLLSCYERSKIVLFIVGAALALQIVATTSIKFNLGVLLGAAAASLMHFKHVTEVLRRNAVPLLVLVGVFGYAGASNDAFLAIVNRGVDRVILGVEVLQARENVPGYSAFDKRAQWQSDGLKGWAENPLFGHGVEAFRDRFGITSHSTPIDILYNFGLIGLALFYAVFFSMLWRTLRSNDREQANVRATIFGTCICYLFVSLSAPLHYNAFFAVFVALSSALLGGRTYSVDRTADSANE